MYSERASIWAVLGVWLGTHAVYYSVVSPAYSHAPSILANSLFFLLWTTSLERQTPSRYACVGAAAGLAALMRWQDAVLLVVPVMEVLYRRENARQALLNLLACGGAFLALLAPQMIAWWIIFGSPAIIPQGEGFMRWTSPSLPAVLFSVRRGLFSWTPLIAASILGLFFAWRRQPLVAGSALVVFGIAWYVNAAVADWWAGEAYGARRFLSCFPIFALGLAALLDQVRGRLAPAAVMCTFIVLNGLLLLQYQLAMHGMEAIAPYPETAFDLWVARFLVPLKLLMGAGG